MGIDRAVSDHAIIGARKDGIVPQTMTKLEWVALHGKVIEEYPDRERILLYAELPEEHLPVQIFATTHNLEMIHAFAEAGLKHSKKDLAAYIELARNIKTGRITGIQRDVETLHYELEREMEIRGAP